jgi:hypothetical protein
MEGYNDEALNQSNTTFAGKTHEKKGHEADGVDRFASPLVGPESRSPTYSTFLAYALSRAYLSPTYSNYYIDVLKIGKIAKMHKRAIQRRYQFLHLCLFFVDSGKCKSHASPLTFDH